MHSFLKLKWWIYSWMKKRRCTIHSSTCKVISSRRFVEVPVEPFSLLYNWWLGNTHHHASCYINKMLIYFPHLPHTSTAPFQHMNWVSMLFLSRLYRYKTSVLGIRRNLITGWNHEIQAGFLLKQMSMCSQTDWGREECFFHVTFFLRFH